MTFADTDSPEFKMSYACMAGQLAAMRQFLESGVDVNHLDDAGFTFLKHAAGNQQLEKMSQERCEATKTYGYKCVAKVRARVRVSVRG